MVSTMAQDAAKAKPSPQLLQVGEKDSKRLLEIYVKRSLSLNDGPQAPRRKAHETNKWVTLAERNRRERRHSSDTSLHLKTSDLVEEDSKVEAFSETEAERKVQTADVLKRKSKLWKKKNTLKRNDGSSASHKSDGKTRKWFLPFEKDKRDSQQPSKNVKKDLDGLPEGTSLDVSLPDHLENSTESKNHKEGKKSKKSSVWKSVLGWFYRGNIDNTEEQDGDLERTEEAVPEPLSPPISCLPISGGDISLQRSKSKRKKTQKASLKRRSREIGLDKATGRPLTLDFSAGAIKPIVKAIEEVEPTSAYYEKVSEEIEKIVYEVKKSPSEENKAFPCAVQPTDLNGTPISQEEVVKRIISLMKIEGDNMNVKMRENPIISSYISKLTYGSFQNLADEYVRSEVPQQKSEPPVASPGLVKFAFALDFTARVAGLSRHAPGHIVGFGNQYLRDRFTHMSESHPHINDILQEKEKKESSDHDGSW